ncbi:creatininase family protein, partial [Pseudomonas sp. MOB-449]|nr:creatininase family protein [Pseudomonas sp. MOB-449]
VAERIDALVLPGLQYGYKSQQKSGGGNHFPGTTSLDGATLTGTVQDIIRELARHGARRLVLMNGHYENSMFIVEGIDLALRELRYAGIQDFKVVVLSYWDFVKDPAVIQRLYPEGFLGWDIEHGGVFETSLMLAL